MTAADAPSGVTPVPASPTTRGPDLALARLHLRLGSLSLARAELETLAGRDALDVDGVLDLAEARWRSGDVSGAGEAAALVLQGDRGPVIAQIIAAEAAMAIGRPSEARRYAARAVAAAGRSLDTLFAGMPRAAVWPADPLVAPPEALSLFEPPPSGPAPSPPARPTAAAAPTAPEVAATTAATIGMWDLDDESPEVAATGAEPDVATPDAPTSTDLPTSPVAGPDPAAAAALAAGRVALGTGDRARAAVHLGLAIRLAPDVASRVLDLVGDDRSPELAFVRGDAYRLVGREADARLAFADVTPAYDDPPIHDDPQTEQQPPQGDPA